MYEAASLGAELSEILADAREANAEEDVEGMVLAFDRIAGLIGQRFDVELDDANEHDADLDAAEVDEAVVIMEAFSNLDYERKQEVLKKLQSQN